MNDSSRRIFLTRLGAAGAAAIMATRGLRECGFSAAELTGVHRENALKLFPRLNS